MSNQYRLLILWYLRQTPGLGSLKEIRHYYSLFLVRLSLSLLVGAFAFLDYE